MDKITPYAPIESLMSATGARLNQIRIHQGKTNEDVEHASGVGRATLSKLWAGKPVKLDTLLRVLQALQQYALIEQLIEPLAVSPLEVEPSDMPIDQRQRVRKSKRPTTKVNGPVFTRRR